MLVPLCYVQTLVFRGGRVHASVQGTCQRAPTERWCEWVRLKIKPGVFDFPRSQAGAWERVVGACAWERENPDWERVNKSTRREMILKKGINRGFEPCVARWQLEQQRAELSFCLS